MSNSEKKKLLIEFADWLQYHGKWMLPEDQAKAFLKHQKQNTV